MRRPSRLRVAAITTALPLGIAVLTGCTHTQQASSGIAPSTAQGVYDEPVLKVTSAYIRQPPTADMAAGYLTITNTGRQPDALTGVTSDAAASVSMHRTTAKDQMEPVKTFSVPAGGRLVMRTGGDHLMLTGFKEKPTAGETVTLHLRFGASDAITVRAPVKPTTYQPSN